MLIQGLDANSSRFVYILVLLLVFFPTSIWVFIRMECECDRNGCVHHIIVVVLHDV